MEGVGVPVAVWRGLSVPVEGVEGVGVPVAVWRVLSVPVAVWRVLDLWQYGGC